MLDHGVDIALGGALRPLIYVEREAAAVAQLAYQMAEGFLPAAPVWSDVATITRPRPRDVIRAGCPQVDILMGGIPCQPWSAIGQKLGAADARDLWPATVRAIAFYKPRLVFLENVTGLLGREAGAFRILRDLHSMGYRATAGIFASSEVGAYHERQRVFILGVADDSSKGSPLNRAAPALQQTRSRSGLFDRDLADRDCVGRIKSGRSKPQKVTRSRGAPAELRREAMADRDGFGFEANRRLFAGREPEPDDAEPHSVRDEVGQAAELANSSSADRKRNGIARGSGQPRKAAKSKARKRGRRRTESSVSGDKLARAGDLPRYAPAQNDFGSWAAVATLAPARMPALESDILRVADGVASRANRISIIGNGVDPLVAAYAFVSLCAALDY